MNIFKDYQTSIAILSGLSIVVFFLSLLALPWMVCKIPEDYFLTSFSRETRQKSLFVRGVTLAVRNLLGGVFFLLGVVLLFLPGQGLLTMFLGVILMDFPGKKKLVQQFSGMENVQIALNWLRQKRRVKPLRFPIP